VLPEIDILGLPLKTFGLCFGLGFLASGAVIARRLRELGRPVDWAYEIAFSALVGGVIGARLWWLADHTDAVRDDLLGSIFSASGLVWYGGVLGGAAAVLLWARWRGALGLGLLDLCAPSLALGNAIGRVGCQLAGDGDYGRATDLPWGMAYPDGVVSTTEIVHPTPIYETLAMGLAAWALWRARGSLRPGLLFASYLVLAGLARFLVEFVRRNEAALAGLTVAQLFSVAMVAGGATWLLVAARRGGIAAEPRRGAAPRAAAA